MATVDWGLTGAVLTIVFGIIAVISTVIVAVRWANRRKPSWGYDTKKVIGLGSDAPPELKLTFGGKPVTDVFRTTVVFYNDGREPIRSNEDVIKPIVVSFGDATILREPIVYPSNADIEFRAKQDQGSVSLSFKYLDHQDGAVVEVFHTACGKPDCQGKIMGTKGISFKGVPVDHDLSAVGKVGAALFVPGVMGLVVSMVLILHCHLVMRPWAAVLLSMLGILLGIATPSFIMLIQIWRFPRWSKARTRAYITGRITVRRPE